MQPRRPHLIDCLLQTTIYNSLTTNFELGTPAESKIIGGCPGECKISENQDPSSAVQVYLVQKSVGRKNPSLLLSILYKQYFFK